MIIEKKSFGARLLQVAALVLALALSGCLENQRSAAGRETDATAGLSPIDELKAGLRENPQDRQAWIRLGRLYLDGAEPARALSSFRRVLALDPENAEARIGASMALLRLGKARQLLSEVADDARIGERNDAILASLKSQALVLVGEHERAKALLERVKKSGFVTPEFWRARIMLTAAVKGNRAALSLADQALAAFPGDAGLILEKMKVVDPRNRDPDAETTLKSLMDPASPDFTAAVAKQAAYLLVNYYMAQGKLADAERIARRALRRYPRDYRSYYLGGLVALVSGRYGVAERRFLKLEKRYRITQVRLLLGMTYMAQGAYERARFYLANYHAAKQDDVWAARLLARVYLILGDMENAESLLSSIDEKHDDAEMEILRGLVALNRGRTDEARARIRRAETLAAEDSTAVKLIARADLALGDYQDAARLARRLLDAVPGDADAVALIVEAYSAQRDMASVEAVLESLSGSGLSREWIETLRGAALLQTGEVEKALSVLRPIVKRNPKNGQAALALALAAEQSRQFKVAESLYKSLYQDSSYRQAAVEGLVRTAYLQDDLKKIRAAVGLAQASRYKAIQPLFYLGAYHLAHHNLEQAGKIVEQMEVLDPGHPESALLMTAIRELQANPQGAKLALTLIEARPGDPELERAVGLLSRIAPDLLTVLNRAAGSPLSRGAGEAASATSVAGGLVVATTPSPMTVSRNGGFSSRAGTHLITRVTQRGTLSGLLRLANAEVRQVARFASGTSGRAPATNYSFGKKGTLAKISRSLFFKYYGVMSEGRLSLGRMSYGLENGVWDGADVYDEGRELRKYLWRDKRWKVRKHDKRTLRMPSTIAWIGIVVIVLIVVARWQKRKSFSSRMAH